MEKLIFISGDSHATPMPDSWETFIEKRFHEHLPSLHQDNKDYVSMLRGLEPRDPEVIAAIDPEDLLGTGGVSGAWDKDRRLQEMDREGVAAEIVVYGDTRAITMFHGFTNRSYPPEVRQAGARAYHRWASATFDGALDRILMLADPGPCLDLRETTAELKWAKEQGFFGSIAPGQTADPSLPPLDERYWDPYWAACVELGMPIAVHAGYGTEQGEFMGKVHQIFENMMAAGRTDLLDEVVNHTEDFFTLDLKPRRVMWQLMLGGVFDRHPGLKVLLCEIRGDWLPATLRHLDTTWERSRSSVPARRRPSEYWQENLMVVLSFMHKAEVDMRHEIGVSKMMFGRDYPHSEGTWPNTRDWLSHALQGVPEQEVRQILGENAIAFVGMDRQRLAEIATRVGPTIGEITGRPADIDPLVLANWDQRGGYLKPPEEFNHEAIDRIMNDDLTRLSTAS